jgi:putative transcription antitermination factor YqgF
MKVLALDYGTVRVGVALSYASLAQPLTILDNNQYLFKTIVDLAQQHHVTQIVVGESENQMAKKTKDFVAKLKKIITLPITLVDETLSTHQVRHYLKTHPPAHRSKHLDHLAAAVILQNFLDDYPTSPVSKKSSPS